MTTSQKGFGKNMTENMEKIKEEILNIVSSESDLNIVLQRLGNLLSTLKPIQDADRIHLVCNASIMCAEKLGRTEMLAQFYIMKAKAEITKPAALIHEMKNLTLALGWFSHALKKEKNKYEELDKKVNESWNTIQSYLNTGFEYLKEKAYVGPAGYCYQIAGEVYGTFYLQFTLYKMGSGKPWRSKIAMLKIIRFLNMDILFLIDKESRKRAVAIRKDSIRYIKEAIRCFKEEQAWGNLADAYLALSTEYRSFNSPIRSRYALYKSEKLTDEHKLENMVERLKLHKSKSIGLFDN
jgi:hypothetical protein